MEKSIEERLSNIEDSLREIAKALDVQLSSMPVQIESIVLQLHMAYAFGCISTGALGIAVVALGAATNMRALEIIGLITLIIALAFLSSSYIRRAIQRVKRGRKN